MDIFHEKAIFDRIIYIPEITEVTEVFEVGNYVNFKSIYLGCLTYQPWDADIFRYGRSDKL